MERSLLEELKLKKLRQLENENEYVWGITALVIDEVQKTGKNIHDFLPKE
jgi:hypothetical protein